MRHCAVLLALLPYMIGCESVGEGPLVLVLSSVILWLARGIRRDAESAS